MLIYMQRISICAKAHFIAVTVQLTERVISCAPCSLS